MFCGSSTGARASYADAARRLGELFVERGIGLVYGGSSMGLMGEVARAVLGAGGEAIGIIPEHLQVREKPFDELTELRIVDTMHERKSLMFDLSDGFIALPGGLGTLEELAEVLTWSQLGLHAKPVGLLDVDGYFSGLAGFFDHAVTEGFVRREHRELLVVDTEPDRLIQRLREFEAPPTEGWMRASER